MFRLFDILILLSAFGALIFSIILYTNAAASTALYISFWAPALLGFGIYIKLIRIVHFVLYKNLDEEATQ